MSKDLKTVRIGKEMEAKYPRLKRRFEELSVKDGVILRGERILILEELRGSVLAAGHDGHLGLEEGETQVEEIICVDTREEE